ncbi:MAG: TauD/TfdA family dioxygenase [Hyphomicrobiales bacterium]|nr:TauD/TfdA family dioxygenase [Hyphomicrobiales bacterium]
MLNIFVSQDWRFSQLASAETSQFEMQKEHLSIPSKSGNVTLAEIDRQVEAGEAVVLRNFGCNPEDLFNLGRAMGSKFHTPIGGSVISTLETIPFKPSVAESTCAIPFHTDFASDSSPPDVLALVCLATDPRYPEFGRNQVAPVTKILDVLEKFVPDARDRLSSLTIPVGSSGVEQVGPILNKDNIQRMIWPAPIINKDLLESKHHFNNHALVDLIEEIGKSVCTDIALGIGDLLVVDNRTALHRRGECTVSLTENGWVGRKIMTARWFRE